MARKDRTLLLFSSFQLIFGAGLWVFFFLAFPSRFFSAAPLPAFVVSWAGAWGTWVVLAVLFAFSWVAASYKFPLGTSSYFVCFDISLAVTAGFLVSPIAAALVAVASHGTDFLRRLARGAHGDTASISDAMGTWGNRLIRFALASLVFQLAGGRGDLSGGGLETVPLLLAFAAYFVANNLFFFPEELISKRDLKAYMKETLVLDLAFSFVICSLGFLLALVAFRLGPGPFFVLAFFVLMVTILFSKWAHGERELKSKLEDVTILSNVSASSASELDVMPMVESFTRSLASHLPADGIGVIFYQRYATTIYVVQVEGDKSRSTYLPEERRFQYERMPLSEANPKLGERLFEFLQPLETAPFVIPASVYGVPLVHGGEPFGGMVLYSYQEGIHFHRKRDLLESCAQSLVVGLENCFLHLQAIQDPLTGLYNRSYFLYRLEEELSFSVRHRAPFALLMLDLDDFKAVNDHLGHEMGDKVLARIGDILRRETRREDVPARYGGDEFIIVLLGCQKEAALAKAEAIRTALASQALPKEEAAGLAIGCSMGMLLSSALRGEKNVSTLIRRLDEALYRAKVQGKNRVVVAE